MIRFGTGGWREIIADGFTKKNVQLLCQGLSVLMKEEKVSAEGIIIGYDRRFLSHEAAEWAAAVLAGNGITVQLILSPAPTPLVMFTVKEEQTPYGLSVTASHNPAIYNGIKLFSRGGRDADLSLTGRLEEIIDSLQENDICTMSLEQARQEGRLKIINPFNRYIDAVIASVDMAKIRESGLKIALDPMYGVSKTSLQTILLTARCDVEVIHERRDTLFGGRLPSPNVETLNTLKQLVREKQSDLGIATDGDADRLGIIDNQGSFVHPNQILVLLYYYLLAYKNWRGPCVRNLATTHMLDRIAHRFGQNCYEVPVGFKHVSAKMQKTDALIGGESSGGLTVKGHIPGKDGIYAATLLVEMLAVSKSSLTTLYQEIIKQFGELFFVERDFRFSLEKKQQIEQQLVEQNLPDFGFATDKISFADGCKVYFKNGGWTLARFSGTEALLRLCAEMETKEQARAVVSRWVDHFELKKEY